MSDWRLAKGLVREMNQCSRCHSEVSLEDFSLEDDMCLFCLFPEASGRRPVPMSYATGDPKNVTAERVLLDELDYIPEKQSKAAKKAYDSFKNRNIYK